MQNNCKESENLLKFLCEIGKLKHLDRKGWTFKDRKIDKPESVAGHMYRMAIMAMLYTPDEGQVVDKTKLLRMALIHDMAESIVGDITPLDGISVEMKHEMEVNAMEYLGSLLPEQNSENFKSLFNEYEARESIESKIVKEFDLFDIMLQAFQYEQIEYNNNGRVIKFQEFFDNAAGKIKSKQLLNISAEIDRKRADFWNQLQTETQQI